MTRKGLKLRIERIDTHVHMRIFYGGAFAGKLTLRTDEFLDFVDELALAGQSLLAHRNLDVFDMKRDDRAKLAELLEKRICI